MNDIDILEILALLIGIQNLYENRRQSAYNDVQSANSAQAEYLMEKINTQFEEQNKKIDKILELLQNT